MPKDIIPLVVQFLHKNGHWARGHTEHLFLALTCVMSMWSSGFHYHFFSNLFFCILQYSHPLVLQYVSHVSEMSFHFVCTACTEEQVGKEQGWAKCTQMQIQNICTKMYLIQVQLHFWKKSIKMQIQWVYLIIFKYVWQIHLVYIAWYLQLKFKP